MSHTHFVTSAIFAFTLIAASMISTAEDLPKTTDKDSQTVTVVQDGATKKDDSNTLSSKRSQYQERNEGVDCFYEENKTDQDCRGKKSGTR